MLASHYAASSFGTAFLTHDDSLLLIQAVGFNIQYRTAIPSAQQSAFGSKSPVLCVLEHIPFPYTHKDW